MNRPHNVFLGRPDTMLGICEAVGQDLGFSPDLLRVGFGVALLFNPVAVIASYLALGVFVMVTRLIWPARATRKPAPLAVPVATREAVNDRAEPELALAA